MARGGKRRADENKRARPQAIDLLVLETRAVELRRERKSYRVIAAVLGVSVGAAFKAVQRGLAKLQVLLEKEAKGLLVQELNALDMAAEALVDAVKAGDTDAIDKWLKIHDRRKLLLGIAPTSATTVAAPDGGPVEVALSWGEEGQRGPGQAAPVAGFVVGEAADGEDPRGGE